MGQTLAQYAATCHDIIKADAGPAGLAKVCDVVKQMLGDAAFIAEHLRADGPERKILYQDPELEFCILAHSYHGAKNAPPHDHGPTWAIYGQAAGSTIMTDWAMVEPATADKPGTVRAVKEYVLTPGMAFFYNPGELHSPKRNDSTLLIRMEGIDVSKIRRLAYKPIETAPA